MPPSFTREIITFSLEVSEQMCLGIKVSGMKQELYLRMKMAVVTFGRKKVYLRPACKLSKSDFQRNFHSRDPRSPTRPRVRSE